MPKEEASQQGKGPMVPACLEGSQYGCSSVSKDGQRAEGKAEFRGPVGPAELWLSPCTREPLEGLAEDVWPHLV